MQRKGGLGSKARDGGREGSATHSEMEGHGADTQDDGNLCKFSSDYLYFFSNIVISNITSKN